MSDNPTPFFGPVFKAEAPKGSSFFEEQNEATTYFERRKRSIGGGAVAATLAGGGAYYGAERLIDAKGLTQALGVREMNKGWKKSEYGPGQKAVPITNRGARRLVGGVKGVETRIENLYNSSVEKRKFVSKDKNGKSRTTTKTVAKKGMGKTKARAEARSDRFQGSKMVKKFDKLATAQNRVHQRMAGKLKGGAAILGAGLTIAAMRNSYKAGQKRNEFAANEIINDLSALKTSLYHH